MQKRLATAPFPLRLGAFLLVLAILWLPFVVIIYATVRDANTISILTIALLFIEFFGLLWFWGRQVYQEPNLFRRYGLVGTRRNGQELLMGLAIGFFSLMLMFLVQSVLGWVTWQSPAATLPRTVAEGLLVGLAIGLGEELIFRGWLLDELERNYSPTVSLTASSLMFAILHFIRPLSEIIRTSPQFPGLVLLGLALVWAKRSSQNRLGMSIGLHAGLVWGYYILNVGQLVAYGRVAEWLTGVNNNPLAGVVGLVSLGAIALYMKRRSTLKYSHRA